MNRTSILVLLGLTTSFIAYVSYEGMSARLARLESVPRVDPRDVHRLREQIASDEVHIAHAIEELKKLHATPDRTESLDVRVEELAKELREASSTLHDQDAKLADWERSKKALDPHVLDERLQAYRASVDDHFRHIDEIAQAALGLAQGTRSDVERVEQNLVRDNDRMWRELVGPTVQLLGDETVGSGVLLPSEEVAPGEWRTFLVTAWHVVRDIQAGPENVHKPVPVTVYAPDKTTTPETAELLKFDAELDIALLKLDTTQRMDCGARLATRAHLENVRIFDQIYAVGCPLGNDPIPTFGEVADTRHVVDGQRYWMISAPTYIGNSGGGIFDARTHELLGIFSKIYTHGSIRPTVVPHMGLATSMLSVYRWLDTVGYASLEPASTPATASSETPAATPATAAASR